MSTADERKGTRVTFLDQTGAKSVEAVIADSVTVKRIMPKGGSAGLRAASRHAS